MLVASLMLVAIASALSLFSPFVVPVAADGVAKLASGTSPGPFAFGGVHTQKGNCQRERERERESERGSERKS